MWWEHTTNISALRGDTAEQQSKNRDERLREPLLVTHKSPPLLFGKADVVW